jgi:hypothetical protein
MTALSGTTPSAGDCLVSIMMRLIQMVLEKVLAILIILGFFGG